MPTLPNNTQVIFKDPEGQLRIGQFRTPFTNESEGWFRAEDNGEVWEKADINEWATVQAAWDAYRLQSIRSYIPPSTLDSSPSATDHTKEH